MVGGNGVSRQLLLDIEEKFATTTAAEAKEAAAKPAAKPAATTAKSAKHDHYQSRQAK